MERECETCMNKDLSAFSATCVECGLTYNHYEPMTKGNLVRCMSDEELADLFAKIEHADPENHLGKDGWLVWLKMEGKT